MRGTVERCSRWNAKPGAWSAAPTWPKARLQPKRRKELRTRRTELKDIEEAAKSGSPN